MSTPEQADLPQPIEHAEDAARHVCATLRAHGYRAYFVGGCVRDRLLGLPVKDFDVATDAPPERLRRLFPRVDLVGASFGVVLVRDSGHSIEVATFRKDGNYVDFRHPSHVEPGTMEEDAARRDFTINALYYDPEREETIDLVGGLEDLRTRTLRAVGDPAKRFHEDALRLLRAVRFAARYGLALDPATRDAIHDLAPNVEFLKAERIREELNRMFLAPTAPRALELLAELQLLPWVLPEIDAMRGVEQGRRFHPEGDVFAHTCRVLGIVEPRTVETVWAALLHDVGKPPTYRRDEHGNIHFTRHEHVGADMARAILARLKFSNAELERIVTLVARHMEFMTVTEMRESTLRRFIGAPEFEELLQLHRADCLGSNGRLDYYDFLRRKQEEFAHPQAPALPPPLVNGHDLQELGMQPGRAIGALLRELYDAQLEGRIATKEQALEAARAALAPPPSG